MEWILGLLVLMALAGLSSKRKAPGKARPQPRRRARPTRPRSARGVSVTFGADPEEVVVEQPVARRRTASAEDCWLPFAASVAVGSTVIPGPVYFGRGLSAVNGRGLEPALIDPDRKVLWGDPDHSGNLMGYWPSYGTIDPRCRAAYLWWLSNGRRYPAAAIGYVFLFFYGLERRALHDARDSAAAREEIPKITAEVMELLNVYGPSSGSFRGYASRFLVALVSLYPDQVSESQIFSLPSFADEKHAGLELVKRRLGRAVTAEQPLAPSLALAWVRADRDYRLSTPAQRCPEAFDRLFAHLYHQQWPDGLLVKPNKTPIRQAYGPASGGLSSVALSDGHEVLPDITVLSGPRKRVQEVIDTALQMLDPYSRHVGRAGVDPHGLEAIALLPEPLRSEARRKSRAVAGLKAGLEEMLGDAPTAQVRAERLLSHAPAWQGGRLTKREYVQLAQVLAMEGYGVEPDIRFGGASPQPDAPSVLFRLPPNAPAAPSEAYAAAALMMGLAVLVTAADGVISREEGGHLEALMEDRLELAPAEKARLRAHTQLLMAAPPRVATLAKRVAPLPEAQRRATGDLLVLVAAADGYIDPSEMKLLSRVFRALNIDEQQLHALAHAAATGPVSVGIPGHGPSTGAPIPVPPSQPGAPSAGHRGGAGPSVTPTPVPGTRGRSPIDPAVLEAKLRETAAVGTILAGVFSGNEPEPEPPPVETVSAGAEPGVAGLDGPHTRLFQSLEGRTSISVEDFAGLAEGHGLLANAAFDVINGPAFDACGAPLLEEGEEGVYDIDTDIYQELLEHDT